MSDATLLAVVGLASAIVGGVIQAVFARLSDAARFERDNKREVYNLFLSSLVGVGTSKTGSNEHVTYSRQYFEARAKIVVHGSPSVVAKLAVFCKHPVLDNDEAYDNLTRLVRLMRLDVGDRVEHDFEEQVRTILFERYNK